MAIKYETPISELGLTTQAPKTLAEAGITTVGQLLDRKRAAIAGLPGLGLSRLADIERALEERGLRLGQPLPNLGQYTRCTSCQTCPDCGNPRATSARNVAVDLSGRASHLGHRVGPTCNGCDKHHRQLFATAAAA